MGSSQYQKIRIQESIDGIEPLKMHCCVLTYKSRCHKEDTSYSVGHLLNVKSSTIASVLQFTCQSGKQWI